MSRHRALIAAATAMLLSATAANAQTQSTADRPHWSVYLNARFGTAIDYPAHVFSVADPEPENGDGQSFHSTDGRAKLAVWGSYNAGEHTPQSYLDEIVKPEGVTYKRATPHFFAVSGRRGGDVYYQRCNFAPKPGDTIHCVTLNYPAGQAATYDGITGEISKSLRAGRVGIE
jgi:hypothetical protein